jgi:hypothetical protein
VKIDKKQLPLVLCLCLVTLGALGYVAFSLLGRHSAKPAMAAVPPAKSETLTETAAPPPATAALLALGPLSHTDPFRPALVDVPEKSSSPKPAAAPARPALPTPPVAVHEAEPDLPAMMGPGVAPPGVAPTPAPTPVATARPAVHVEPAKPARPSIALAGIIAGDNPVAILKLGDAQRQVVQEQDLVAGRYRVAQITPTGIVLVAGTERWRLGLED